MKWIDRQLLVYKVLKTGFSESLYLPIEFSSKINYVLRLIFDIHIYDRNDMPGI